MDSTKSMVANTDLPNLGGTKKKKPKKIDILKCVGEIYGDEEGLTGMMGKWGMRVSMHCVHVQSHLRRNLMKNKTKQNTYLHSCVYCSLTYYS